ncbi:hypothetical protein ACGFZJ_42085 [Streptomyces sp. NPDC048253]|uniref:hypothetical protein n=1 Tax=unclassified Streptomyces TaxID=2593676 RepID=UPI0006CDD886|nr:hypothetical protein OV320_1269 [Actinobacteria bacterium OV320]
MNESFEELELRYRMLLNRVTDAQRVLRDVMGDPKPLAPAEEPPILTKAQPRP